MGSSDAFGDLWRVLRELNLIPIIVAVIIVVLIYFAIGKILARFRARGLISRGVEQALKFASFTLLALTVFSIALSFFLQLHLLAVVFIVLLMMFIGMMMYSVRTYVENAISYILFVSSRIVSEGDMVEVLVGDSVYRGRISIAEGGYAVIDSGEGRIYIPYSVLLRSVISKVIHHTVKFTLSVRGQNLDMSKVVGEVDSVLKEIKIINRESVSVRPTKVEDTEIAFRVSVEVLNPRNIEEFCELVSKTLARRLPYSFSIRFEPPSA